MGSLACWARLRETWSMDLVVVPASVGLGSEHLFPGIKINRKLGSCWRLAASEVRRSVGGWVAPPSASDPRIRLPQPQWGPGGGFGWT